MISESAALVYEWNPLSTEISHHLLSICDEVFDPIVTVTTSLLVTTP